jgi:hypothetical protein
VATASISSEVVVVAQLVFSSPAALPGIVWSIPVYWRVILGSAFGVGSLLFRVS